MEIRQLRAFVAIAESSTFTAGAERVNVTQAAISMQIKQLEESLGVLLFARLPRQAVLTEAGERLLPRARKILREHEAGVAEMAELAGAERGRLRAGSASAMISTDPLPELLHELLVIHPQAEISVASGTSNELIEQILGGALDVAFVSLPIEAQGVQAEVLTRDELVAIGSPHHPLAGQRVVNAQTLAGEKLILGEKGGNTRRLIDRFFADAGVKPTVIMELNRLTSIKRMVEEGMGVGIVPSQSVRSEVAAGKLASWWVKGAKINWELGLARLSGGYVSPVIQTFSRLCHKYYHR
ncbi:MAG: LysR family transcriptional regulator [Pyrinomonadaceae bacterium]